MTSHDREDFSSLVIDLATDIWRLNRLCLSIEVPLELSGIIERLSEDLLVNSIEIIDPVGQVYDKNANCEVMYISDGDGILCISETIAPGIRTSRGLIARPKVYLAPQGGH